MKLLSRLLGKPSILELEMTPHVGVGSLKLSMTRDEISSAMKTCGLSVSSTAHGHLYFLENAIMVEFQPNGEASFIGVAPHQALRLTFQGISLFETNADRVFELFQKDEGEAAVNFDQHEHVFMNQIVTLWDPDTQYDLNGEQIPIWGQIGIGNRQYLRDCSAL